MSCGDGYDGFIDFNGPVDYSHYFDYDYDSESLSIEHIDEESEEDQKEKECWQVEEGCNTPIKKSTWHLAEAST